MCAENASRKLRRPRRTPTLTELSFAGYEKQDYANDYGSRTSPSWNVDPLFLFHLQFDWPYLRFVSLLGEAETPIDQPQNAGQDQNHSDDLDCIHSSSPPAKNSFLAIATILCIPVSGDLSNLKPRRRRAYLAWTSVSWLGKRGKKGSGVFNLT